MLLNIVDRHKFILSMLEKKGFVTANELSQKLKVSVVTIRKDLKLLEEKNLLFRSHGKAIPTNPYITETPVYVTEDPVNIKEKINIKEKNKIAIVAESLLKPHDNIIIASGTSVIEFAKCLKPIEELTVVTASLNISLMLSRNSNIDVIQLGGIVRQNSSSVIGSISERMLSEFTFTKLFLGVDGIDLEYGLTTTNSMEASLNKEMIKVAQKIIVLADSSKFGKRGFGRICGFDDIDQIITDSGICSETKEKLNKLNIEVTIVSV